MLLHGSINRNHGKLSLYFVKFVSIKVEITLNSCFYSMLQCLVLVFLNLQVNTRCVIIKFLFDFHLDSRANSGHATGSTLNQS